MNVQNGIPKKKTVDCSLKCNEFYLQVKETFILSLRILPTVLHIARSHHSLKQVSFMKEWISVMECRMQLLPHSSVIFHCLLQHFSGLLFLHG